MVEWREVTTIFSVTESPRGGAFVVEYLTDQGMEVDDAKVITTQEMAETTRSLTSTDAEMRRMAHNLPGLQPSTEEGRTSTAEGASSSVSRQETRFEETGLGQGMRAEAGCADDECGSRWLAL